MGNEGGVGGRGKVGREKDGGERRGKEGGEGVSTSGVGGGSLSLVRINIHS